MKKLLLIILLSGCGILLSMCGKETTTCNCEVTYQTTKSGLYWSTESIRQRQEIHANCDDGDRTDVIVMPLIYDQFGTDIYTTNGIREVIDCN